MGGLAIRNRFRVRFFAEEKYRHRFFSTVPEVDLNLLLSGMLTIDFQIAKIGMTEQEAIKEGYEVKTLRTPNAHNTHAHILGQIAGYVLLVAESGTGKILAGEIVGADAIT